MLSERLALPLIAAASSAAVILGVDALLTLLGRWWA